MLRKIRFTKRDPKWVGVILLSRSVPGHEERRFERPEFVIPVSADSRIIANCPLDRVLQSFVGNRLIKEETPTAGLLAR
jgi:hypothetical protein